VRGTDAHQTDGLAEMVCSNSFRSDDWQFNAVGLLHAEMRKLDSLIMSAADQHQVPAGGALAVDRDGFSAEVTRRIEAHPLITIAREEIAGLPPEDWDSVVVATGPLTSPALADAILELSGEGQLSFFDAIAPIIHVESIDMDIAWRQSRYDKEGPGGDAAAYINCPMDKAAVRGLHRRPAGRSEGRVQGLGACALFRRLPADRGDGRARPRDPAPWPDEAGRPDQPARPDWSRPTPSSSCARTTPWPRCGTWWASRPS
jgi:hypothetical protein